MAIEIQESAGTAATPAPNKHRIKSERTRQAIMDAAEPLFAPSGMAGASMRQIAKAAGVDMSLVSYHFENKAALFQAVVDRIIIEFSDRRDQALAEVQARLAQPTAADLFEVQIEAFLDIRFSGQPHRARMILNRFHESEEGLRAGSPSDPFVTRFLDALVKAVPRQAPEYVHWAYHGVMGSLVYYMSSGQRIGRISKGYCNVHSRSQIREAVLNAVRKLFADDDRPEAWI